MEELLTVGYEKAKYEKDGKITEYLKYYVKVGDNKLYFKLVDGNLAKDILKTALGYKE